MATAAELYALVELNDANLVTIFFTKESYCSKFLSFLHRYVAVILKGNVLADAAVDDALYLTEFLGGDFLEV